MREFCILVFCLLVGFSRAQSKHSNFFKLSKPAKKWVLMHPFKAKKALRISLEAKRIADSIQKTALLDSDADGGQVDAFRHAFWMARIQQELGRFTAKTLGEAHEKENYITYKKQKIEESTIPDEISSKMDIWNNNQGLLLTIKGSEISKKGLIFKVINAIKAGKMKIVKKDKQGRFLTCNGVLIQENELKGKWKNNKCLIKSD